MLTPFFCHWYVKGAVPVAVAENMADCPTLTVWPAGCSVNAGAVEFVEAGPITLPMQPHNVSANAKTNAAAANCFLGPVSMVKSRFLAGLTGNKTDS